MADRKIDHPENHTPRAKLARACSGVGDVAAEFGKNANPLVRNETSPNGKAMSHGFVFGGSIALAMMIGHGVDNVTSLDEDLLLSFKKTHSAIDLGHKTYVLVSDDNEWQLYEGVRDFVPLSGYKLILGLVEDKEEAQSIIKEVIDHLEESERSWPKMSLSFYGDTEIKDITRPFVEDEDDRSSRIVRYAEIITDPEESRYYRPYYDQYFWKDALQAYPQQTLSIERDNLKEKDRGLIPDEYYAAQTVLWGVWLTIAGIATTQTLRNKPSSRRKNKVAAPQT